MPLWLRDAKDEDAAGVIDLVGRVFAEYPGCVLDVEAEAPELLAPRSSFDGFFVLDRDGEIVGCGGYLARADHVELVKLYLDPSVRGRGFARRITERVEGCARRLGLFRVELWTDTRFTAAHGLYLHLGYAPTGRTRELHDLSLTTELHFVKQLGGPRPAS